MPSAINPFENYTPVPESGCWLWLGKWSTSGYGLRTGRTGERMHREFFAHHVGPIPVGMMVCHKCDTPACVNPAHLFLGTPADNMADRKAKGRAPKPAGKPRAKLNEQDVSSLRGSVGVVPQRDLAKKFGVTPRHITEINAGRVWKP